MTSSEGRLLFHITILSAAKDLIVKILRPFGPQNDRNSVGTSIIQYTG